MCLNRGVTYNGVYCLGNAIPFICQHGKKGCNEYNEDPEVAYDCSVYSVEC